MEVSLHPFKPEDAAAVTAIHAHYVNNTVATFRTEPYTPQQMLDNLSPLPAAGYPVVVAKNGDGTVIGFSYLSGFRSSKMGYRHTAELSLWCHTEHRRQGVGPKLLEQILKIAKEPEGYSEYVVPRGEDMRIRHVLAVMGVDVTGPMQGRGLVEFYKRFGFVEKGGLKEVGHKFDRWIDTVYMQLSLW